MDSFKPTTNSTLEPDDPTAMGRAEVEPTDSASKRKWIIFGAIGAAVVLLVLATTGFAFAYQGKALPGTSVAGESVSGLTAPEISALVDTRAENVTVSLTVDGTDTSASLEDLGVKVDGSATAAEAVAAGQSFFGRLGSMFSSRSIPAVITIDEDQLDSFMQELNGRFGVPVQEAKVTFSPEAAAFVATESSPGRGVDQSVVREIATSAGTNLTSESAQFVPEDLLPVVTTENAQAAAASANQMLSPEVVLTDGITDFPASVDDRASWIDIPTGEDGLGSPAFDRGKIEQWVKAVGESTNDDPIEGINNVNAAGEVLVEAFPAKDGLHVNNVAPLTDSVLAALNSGQSFDGSFDYEVVTATYKTRQALPGAENLPYPAAEGEKWVDINLSTYTVTPYIGQDPVNEGFPLVPGRPGRETVTGIYHVYLKYEYQDMGCTPEWDYCARDVPWVSYFTGSYALHGAPWQSFFGPGAPGSSGCVNMPVDSAKWIYDWTELGTPVASHY